MFLALYVAICYINNLCPSLIGRKNIVFVVSKPMEPSCRHGKHNGDIVEHILNAYGNSFFLTSLIEDPRIDCGQNYELHYIFTHLCWQSNHI